MTTARALAWLFCLLPVACTPPDRHRPLAVWLSAGASAGQTTYPRAICYNSSDNTFIVVDRLAYVTRLSVDGVFLNRWQMPDHAAGKPVGVSTAPVTHAHAGLIFVADTHYHRVVVFRPDGSEAARFGVRGTGPGQFIFPTDVAFDHSGHIYISEYGDNDRIQVFQLPADLAQPWIFVRSFGSPGQGPSQFSRPQSIAIAGDELFVADAANHRISVFDLTGAHKRSLGTVGTGPGQLRFPYGLEMHASGNLLITEFGNNRVQLLHPYTGSSLATWGTGGRLPGELAYPFASTSTPDGTIATADSGNNRIQVFKFSPTVLP